MEDILALEGKGNEDAGLAFRPWSPVTLRRAHARLPLCLLTLLLALPLRARADPLTPWPGEQTAPGTLQIVPILYLSGDGRTFSPLFYASTGFGEAWDLYVGVWGSIGFEGSSFDLVDVFPRYHLSPQTALALRLQATPDGSLTTGAEVHTNLEWDHFSLMINTGVRPEFDLPSGSLRSAGLFAILAPEYHFTELFSVYCEVDPSVAYRPLVGASTVWGSELSIIPGISFSLDPEETHQFSIGAEFALRRGEDFALASSVTFGAWYATSFDLGGKAKEEDSTRPQEALAPRRFSPRGRATLARR